MRLLPLLLFCSLYASGQHTIGLLFLDNCNVSLQDSLACRVRDFYGEPVVVLKARPFPKVEKIDTGYNAGQLIRTAIRYKGTCDRIVVITSRHIVLRDSATYQSWGLFGLSMYPENVVLVSTHVMRGPLLLERTFKVVQHEMAHTYHVPHCTRSESCVMNIGVGYVTELDLRTGLCEECRWLQESYKKFHAN